MTGNRPSTADKRKSFRRLHESGCFVIPNPWNVGSARYLQGLGFKALATTSSGHAHSEGFADGAQSRDQVLAHFRELAEAADVPLNADFENGFADGPDGVAENVTREVHLLEGFGVHEIVVLAVVVQIFHLLFIEGGALDAVFRREAMFGHGPTAQAAHFHLHETAQVAGSAVLHFENGIEFVVELDDHARTELCRCDHGCKLQSINSRGGGCSRRIQESEFQDS